jgi:hypothetical protein
MAAPLLRAVLNPRSGGFAAVKALCNAAGDGISVFDASGKALFGEGAAQDSARASIDVDGATLGYVTGAGASAPALALLLQHLVTRESEQRALASETLHLYREINLIEQLSEQLAAILNLQSVSESALAQARRLIPATHGSMLVLDKIDADLRTTASFADPISDAGTIAPASLLAATVLERGVAEILNDCSSDPRARGIERGLQALLCAPLRAGQRTVGLIALGSTGAEASYSTAHLKLLNTIALQAAAAIENAMLCAEMVETARERAAYAAELQAASSVQQLLLQSASLPTPGFHVESVYLPASEVGGDFFLVQPAPNGSIAAILGDVSGKGLTAAMRVAMILGVLRRETSHNPGEILSNLNQALIAQGQLGFATACCIRIEPTGQFAYANAGHIAPYLCGQELESIPALPLGLVADQTYPLVLGRLKPGDRLVLLSDGVPEARSQSGELFGFDDLPNLTLKPAEKIAAAAKSYGQEDDISVLTLALA